MPRPLQCQREKRSDTSQRSPTSLPPTTQVPFEGPPPKAPAAGSVSRLVQIAEEAAAAEAAGTNS